MNTVSGAVTPKEFTGEISSSPDSPGIDQFLVEVKRGIPWSIKTEVLVRLNGNRRRGKWVNYEINEHLRRYGLVCTPEIENADYYGKVVVSDPRDEVSHSADTVTVPLSSFANSLGTLLYCGNDMLVSKVRALMISNDISQLPVLSAKQKQVEGVVTWRSLAQKSNGGSDERASAVMDPPGPVSRSGDSFIDLVDRIIAEEYVLYTLPDGTVGGIVTASDLAQAFDDTASLYVRLQEIESRIRVLLDRAPLPQLEKHLGSRSRLKAAFRGASDMTFGEYLSALADDDIWAATKILFEKPHFLSTLDKVRTVRNSVMHFASDVEPSGDDSEQHGAKDVRMAMRLLREIPL